MIADYHAGMFIGLICGFFIGIGVSILLSRVFR